MKNGEKCMKTVKSSPKTQILGNKKRNSSREEFFIIKSVDADDEVQFIKSGLMNKVKRCLKL